MFYRYRWCSARDDHILDVLDENTLMFSSCGVADMKHVSVTLGNGHTCEGVLSDISSRTCNASNYAKFRLNNCDHSYPTDMTCVARTVKPLGAEFLVVTYPQLNRMRPQYTCYVSCVWPTGAKVWFVLYITNLRFSTSLDDSTSCRRTSIIWPAVGKTIFNWQRETKPCGWDLWNA